MVVFAGTVVGTGFGIPRETASEEPRLLILSEDGLYTHSVELTNPEFFDISEDISDITKYELFSFSFALHEVFPSLPTVPFAKKTIPFSQEPIIGSWFDGV
jgi:hypothetical protein